VTHPFRNIIKSLLLAGLVLAVVGVGQASASVAKAAKSKPPCWKTLINDWYDGRIDGTYPIQCYRDALKHLPADVEAYSSARDDIKQALQKRITQGSGGHTSTTGSSGSPGPGGPSGPTKSGPSGPQNPSHPSTPIRDAFGKSSHADSVPLPLIVLGAVALLLMALGAGGFVARRMRTRKLQLASAAAATRGAGKPPTA
jgi:hypothetical protein